MNVTKAQLTKEHISQVAKKLFLEQGLGATEMKHVAETAGVSRSTLYRCFETKDTLAFQVSQMCLGDIFTERKLPLHDANKTGYEILELYIHSLLDDLIENVRSLKYLSEFDRTFTGDYPNIPEAEGYVEFNRKKHDMMLHIIKRGIADGSIREDSNIDLVELAIGNTLLGISQRILPREAHYQTEFGYGKEIVYKALDMLLLSLKKSDIE